MRLLAPACAILSLTASAFDSEAWLLKREVLAREAERLEAAYARCSEDSSPPAENVHVPLVNNPDGSIKTMVSAKRAKLFLDAGLIWGDGVVVKELSEAGKSVSHIVAQNCLADRNTKSCWINGKARATYRGTVLDGSRVYLSSDEEFVSIFRDAKVVSDCIGRPGKGARAAETVVTSKRADYDRRAGVILMEGDVRLANPEYALASDRAFAFLVGTNDVRRIVAVGHVAVTNGLRRGSCDRAVYDRFAGKVTMYGAEGAPASLEDGGERDGRLYGSQIDFWLDREQVEVKNSLITVRGDGKGGLKAALGGVK